MFTHRSQTLPTEKKKWAPNKLIAGFSALAITSIITATSFAGASPMNKPSKEDCKKAGFTNYGQCVKEWAHHKNNPGGGYGGNHSATTNVNLSLNHSNNNIFHIIINIFN